MQLYTEYPSLYLTDPTSAKGRSDQHKTPGCKHGMQMTILSIDGERHTKHATEGETPEQ